MLFAEDYAVDPREYPPPKVAVNIITQYRPEYHADEYKEIAGPISREEYLQVKEYAETLDLFLI